MSYDFLDAHSSVLTADSSIISGSGLTGVRRPIVNIGSIIGDINVIPNGSITTLQGTNPWVISNPSVTAFQGGVWATSIVGGPIRVQSILGTYLEDSAHATEAPGIFTFGVRNDTLSSVTSTDGDYSPNTVGPVGETVIANSPITKWVQGVTSVMYGTSVQALAAQGASIFTYITAVQIANDSPNYSRVTFTGGLGGTSSLLGVIPAPATGGAIVTLPNAWKTGANMGVSTSISGVSSIYVSLQGFISKT